VAVTERAEPELAIAWRAQAGPQWQFIRCPVFEVFFGGARGGGKTDAVLGEWASHAGKYGADAIGLMIRKTRTELVETIERSRIIYSPLGAKYNEQDKMWRFPNGARLRFAYLERDADAEAYQGHSYTRVYVEEIGNFPTAAPILKLMATLRSGAGVPVGFRATGNPGGPGHSWVKARYIDPAPSGWRVIRDERSGLQRVYIPSRVGDNAFLGADYVQRLRASGSEALVKAWLEGDWSAIDGAFFDVWSNARHVVRPFSIPEHWLRFRSMDWGSASPFSVGWWAVVGDEHRPEEWQAGAGEGVAGRLEGDRPLGLPRGCLVRYREWYGASEPGVGLKLTAEEVARGIRAREANDYANGKSLVSYGVLDPSAFAEDGGPSIAERMAREGVVSRRADNKRVPAAGAMGGWDQLRARLKGDLEGRPMVVCFSTCVDSIRTIPVLQHDPDRPEDLDTDAEDHAADDWRYGCMSRPWVPIPAKPPKPTEMIYEVKPDGSVQSNMGIRDMIDMLKRKKLRA
jgi:hypothetical protein